MILLAGVAPLSSAGELKVDINNSGRKWTEGTDPAFVPWSTEYAWLSGGDSTTATFDGVTITFRRIGPNGSGLRAGYWKNGVVDLGVKLLGDGLKVDSDDSTPVQIEMRIKGLSPGMHTLLTYHNDWDNHTAYSVAPLDIFVDGVQVVDDLQVTVRAASPAEAATAYLEFEVAAGRDVVILFSTDPNSGAAKQNVWINGFEIDTADLARKAIEPCPANGDEHVDADNKTVLLSWTAAPSAVLHDVYLGTEMDAVKKATRNSAEFKGNQAANEYLAEGIDSLLTYYWRVDEIDAEGRVTRGDVWMFRPRHLAFPGAEGYGRFARGGRGGVVVKVTNLRDNGPGSLRDAIEGDYGPRTVIFDVGGLITLDNDIIIAGDRPYITVAGQTAPGKGICIKRQQFGLSGARDVIVRFIRVRVGKESGETQNASGMAGVDHCIMDHCSISWGIDEGISSRNAKNLTLQRTLIAEALNIAGHDKYPPGKAHGFAASIGGDIGSFHHNLLAHCAGRNWSLAGGLDGAGFCAGRLDIFNNVVYNWNSRTTDGGAHQVNFVNNYYKPGPASVIFTALNPQYEGFPGTQQYYMAGNLMPAYFDEANQMAGTRPEGNPPYSLFVDKPFFESYATIHTARNAYKQVLSDVGCNLPMIDQTDSRIIRETIEGNYTYVGSISGLPGLPDTTDDVGGWEDYPEAHRPADWDTDNDGLPNWWEKIHGLDPNSPPGDLSDSNGDPDGDGYTNLEEYLDWMAQPHVDCQAGSSVDVDLYALSRGYLKTGPQYTFSNQVNGTVTLISGRYARFTAATSHDAIGGFSFTVTDQEGDSMTRRVNVRIIAGL
ncbi:MAG: thrombospondin type 3 repeat-containing protein [Sedimentisphaerales bacterium]|nr:thrombospondin type 3 repeat-containing protein [Sedimentisphaerales bacterium]